MVQIRTSLRPSWLRLLELPVKVGKLEVFVPPDVGKYELEREPGESDRDFEATKATFEALFKTALK